MQNETFLPEKKHVSCLLSIGIAHLYNGVCASSSASTVGDTRRVFFTPQPNSSAELYDAIKKRFPSRTETKALTGVVYIHIFAFCPTNFF